MVAKIVAVLVAGCGLLIGAAAPAQADAYSFVGALYNNAYAEFNGPATGFVSTGHRVCEAVYAGHSEASIVRDLFLQYDFDWVSAEVFYYLALEELC